LDIVQENNIIQRRQIVVYNIIIVWVRFILYSNGGIGFALLRFGAVPAAAAAANRRRRRMYTNTNTGAAAVYHYYYIMCLYTSRGRRFLATEFVSIVYQ